MKCYIGRCAVIMENCVGAQGTGPIQLHVNW